MFNCTLECTSWGEYECEHLLVPTTQLLEVCYMSKSDSECTPTLMQHCTMQHCTFCLEDWS